MHKRVDYKIKITEIETQMSDITNMAAKAALKVKIPGITSLTTWVNLIQKPLKLKTKYLTHRFYYYP